jgi:hypothetical protein
VEILEQAREEQAAPIAAAGDSWAILYEEREEEGDVETLKFLYK